MHRGFLFYGNEVDKIFTKVSQVKIHKRDLT